MNGWRDGKKRMVFEDSSVFVLTSEKLRF